MDIIQKYAYEKINENSTTKVRMMKVALTRDVRYFSRIEEKFSSKTADFDVCIRPLPT